MSTWVVLTHAPGPAASGEGSIFDQPEFRKHIEFLRRMQECGYLAAAGPFGDGNGEGMTILRLPDEFRLADAERLATQDDESVASGFLRVTVRPWKVMLTSWSPPEAGREGAA